MASLRPAHRTHRFATNRPRRANARRLGERLKGLKFNKVFTSPLQRAMRTCGLAGFGAQAEIDRDFSNGITANTKGVDRSVGDFLTQFTVVAIEEDGECINQELSPAACQ